MTTILQITNNGVLQNLTNMANEQHSSTKFKLVLSHRVLQNRIQIHTQQENPTSVEIGIQQIWLLKMGEL